LEQRALSVLASAGVIGSLAGISARSAGLPDATRTLLVVALVGLGAAAVMALLVAYPVSIDEVDADSLRLKLEPAAWAGEAETHLRLASTARLHILENFRAVNAHKALFLRVALIATGVGVVFLLAGVVVALIVG
jgi:hypothetical protein